MRILVTGSSGTIGTRLCEQLLAKGHDVVGLDRVPNKWQPAIQDITVMADLLDPTAINAVPDGIEAIVHLAANARVYDLVTDPTRARDNVLSTFNTLEFARARGIKKFIFSSSRETYGNVRRERYTEDMVRIEACESAYTASKIAGEAFVQSYANCYGIRPVIFRFSNVYGMYDDSDRVIPLFIRQVRAGETLTVFGKEKLLDFTYIDDTTAAVIQALERFDAVAGETFNLGNGDGTSLTTLAETINKLLGGTSPVTFAPSRTGEVTHYIADITHARTKLGYDPTVPFADGIVRTVEWYSANMA